MCGSAEPASVFIIVLAWHFLPSALAFFYSVTLLPFVSFPHSVLWGWTHWFVSYTRILGLVMGMTTQVRSTTVHMCDWQTVCPVCLVTSDDDLHVEWVGTNSINQGQPDSHTVETTNSQYFTKWVPWSPHPGVVDMLSLQYTLFTIFVVEHFRRPVRWACKFQMIQVLTLYF